MRLPLLSSVVVAEDMKSSQEVVRAPVAKAVVALMWM